MAVKWVVGWASVEIAVSAVRSDVFSETSQPLNV